MKYLIAFISVYSLVWLTFYTIEVLFDIPDLNLIAPVLTTFIFAIDYLGGEV